MTNIPRVSGMVSGQVDAPVTTFGIPRINIAAFFETQEAAAAVEAAAADRRMARASVTVRPGGIAAAIALYRQTPPPNLIILESQADRTSLFEDLGVLAQECLPGTKVIVIGHSNDIALYRELLQRGVSDLLVPPLHPISVIEAIARAFQDTAEQRLGRITAFMGARGGTGSSTVAHNVAAAIAGRLGGNVLLADLDLPFGTVGLDFNMDAAHGMADVLHSVDRIDDVLLDRVAAKRTERLQILTAASSLDRAFDLKESDLERLLDVAQSSARHLILDLPQAWTSWSKKALMTADEIVITATPDLTSMRNAKQIIEYLRRTRPNDSLPRLVLNQVGVPKRPEIKRADFAAAVQLDPSICIPFDSVLFGVASNNGQTVVESSSKSSAAQSFEDLGSIVSGRREPRSRQKGARSFIARFVGKA